MKIKKIIKELELIPVGTEMFFNGPGIECFDHKYKKINSTDFQRACPHDVEGCDYNFECSVEKGNPHEFSTSEFARKIECYVDYYGGDAYVGFVSGGNEILAIKKDFIGRDGSNQMGIKELVITYLESRTGCRLKFINVHTGLNESIRLIDGVLKKFVFTGSGIGGGTFRPIIDFDKFVSANHCEFLQGFFVSLECKETPVSQALDEAARLVGDS